MAHILPETLPQTIPNGVLRVFRSLKLLPDTFYIWHHLAPWQPLAPDFLVLDKSGRALLVKVSSATASEARPAAQLKLLGDEDAPLGFAEARVLQAFKSSVSLPADQEMETLIIFPFIPNELVQASRISRQPGEPQWAGKEILQSELIIGMDKSLPLKPMDSLCLEKLRQCFTPEIVVPEAMTVRTPEQRRLDVGLNDYLLDYSQEQALKSDLDLSIEGESLTNDLRLNIINGVAGSGKTLILLYRLRLLYHLYPNKRFLVLTHNRPLNFDMQSRFTRLEGCLPDNIEWGTFNAWCRHHWPAQPSWKEPMKRREREKLIGEIYAKYLKSSNISPSMLQSEIDWMKDHTPSTLSEYLEVDRRGRGFSLNTDQRRQMFDAMTGYQKRLKERQMIDWGDIPRQLWQFAEKELIELPSYDVILIDEAQFFAPIWIKLVMRSLNPKNGHLFLVADPTQGFLGRGESWKSLGLDARGHTVQLRKSYRTTREIMQFATLFYRLRLKEEKDEDILAPDLLKMPAGVFPEIIPLSSPQDEITRIANEVCNFVRNGYPRKHLLVLHTDGRGVSALIQAIDERLGKNVALDPKSTYPGDYIRVTTINAGAGLESPIVFIAGVRNLFEEEQSLRLSDSEKEAVIRDNTRKLYMAATRAGQRLVLTYVGNLPDVVVHLQEMKNLSRIDL